MKESLFLDFICSLPRHPKHALVFVIDALDECGDDQNRPVLLKGLTDAASHAPWLKIIVTSRSEDEIQHFFNCLPHSSYWRYDLATDQEAGTDLQTFARSQLALVAKKWCLPAPWPAQAHFNQVISQANGLFIFIKTLVLTLRQCEDPDKTLEAALPDSASTGLKPLYSLYSNILKERRVPISPEFRQMIGVLLAVAPYRTLCEESIAKLAGVRPHLVQKWVNDLGSPAISRRSGQWTDSCPTFVNFGFLYQRSQYLPSKPRRRKCAAGNCLPQDDGRTAPFQYLQARRFPACECGYQ